MKKSDEIIQRLRISMTVSASRDSGFAANPGETHLKCNSVEPSWANLAGVVVTVRVSTSLFFDYFHSAYCGVNQ